MRASGAGRRDAAESPRPTAAGTAPARRGATGTAAPRRRSVHPLRSRLTPGVASGCASRSPYSIGAIIWRSSIFASGGGAPGRAVNRRAEPAGRRRTSAWPGDRSNLRGLALRRACDLIADPRDELVVVRRIRRDSDGAAFSADAYACNTPSSRWTAAGPAPGCVAPRETRHWRLQAECRRRPGLHRYRRRPRCSDPANTPRRLGERIHRRDGGDRRAGNPRSRAPATTHRGCRD